MFHFLKKKIDSGHTSCHWYSSVDEIVGPWAECFDAQKLLKGYFLQKTVEEARLPDVEIHHLVVKDGQGTAAVIPCYAFKYSLMGVSTPQMQKVVTDVQKVFPGFMVARIFVVGSAISTCGDLLGFKDMFDKARWPASKVAGIFEEIKSKAKKLGIRLLIIKEMEDDSKNFLDERLDRRCFFVESLPLAALNVASRERGGYLESIRTRYRNKLKKRKSVSAEHGMSWEIVPSMKGQEEAVFALYEQVVGHADQVFERLNKDFFVKASEYLGKDSFYVCGYQTQGGKKKLVSCEFVMREKDTLHALYSGFDYTLKRDSDLYFNAFYAIIEEAERLGCTRVTLGQTSYEVKAELGCNPVRLWVGVYHSNPLIRGIMWLARGLFFPKTEFPERDVFATPPAPKKSGQKARAAT